MSLAQHVTQAEGFDYDSLPSNQSTGPESNGGIRIPSSLNEALVQDKQPEWQQLNYAPVDVTLDEPPPAIAAYKVSDAKRVAQVATAIVACWLSAGIVFGFAALKPILVAEGVYQELCKGDHEAFFNEGHVPCSEQDLRLNLFFIVASITANVSSLLAGAVLDRYGRRTCWLIACLLLAIGSVLMVSSYKVPRFDGYLVANVFLALGGTFIFLPSFQLANAFPKHSGLIVAVITGAFDCSAAVFLLYSMAYEASQGALSLDKLFLGYLIVPVLILITEFALMPRNAYHTIPQLHEKIDQVQDVTQDVHESDDEITDSGELTRVRSARADKRHAKLDQIEGLAGDADERDERLKTEEARQEASGVWGVLHGVPAHRQMMTPWFILILMLTILQMLRMNYFIATVRAQYRYMLGSDKLAEKINSAFDVALPIGGVASTPFIGLFLNNLGVPTVFGALTVFIIVIGVLNCLPFLWAGYITVITFVIFRPLYYSAVSDYATKVFGFATFGRIYGMITCVSGLVQFAPSGLDALTHGPLHGDPTLINIALGASGALVGLVLTVFLAIKSRTFVAEKSEMEADHERQRLLSVDQDGYGAARP